MKVYIRERRMERHMTQKALANQLLNKAGKNIDQSELSKYEKGKIPIPVNVLLQIAFELDYPVEQLIELEEHEHKHRK